MGRIDDGFEFVGFDGPVVEAVPEFEAHQVCGGSDSSSSCATSSQAVPFCTIGGGE